MFKSGLIHMTRNEILPDLPDGQRHVRIVVSDGNVAWSAFGAGWTQAEAIEAAYANALKRHKLPPDRLITVQDIIQRMHAIHKEKVAKMNATGFMPLRDFKSGTYKR